VTGAAIVEDMPRVSAFYGVVIYMYWNERDHPVATSTRTIRADAPQYQRTEMCWPAASIPGLFSSSGNGLSSAAVRSWRTGSAPGGTSPCSASTRWRSMKIVDKNYLPVVVGAAVVGDRVLRLLFSDGTAGDVDFSTERWEGVLSPLNDPAYFAKVTVDQEAGTLVWPDGIDLAPEPLYEQAKAHPLLAA
jgi:hypothetical protein